ncbi:MAG: 5-formyltetrahydrofolate cyclo-ligase [Bacillota bacterium]
MDKATLRTTFLKRRKLLDEKMHQLFSMMLKDKLKTYLKEHNVKTLGIYYPMRKEIDLLDFKDEFDTHLPKVGKKGIVYYQDRGAYEPAPFHTTVPTHNDITALDSLDAVIVPGLVFDKDRYRIGYGKGYYDELLSRYKGLSIGVCFELFMLDSIPKEPHDKQCDVLITESRIIKE